MSSSVLKYKGYSARVAFDGDDKIFFGNIAGIRDMIGFHADTVDDLVSAFHDAVDDYIVTCAKVGKSPERPYSGKLMLRVAPHIHAATAQAAELAGMSLNQWSEKVLSQAAKAQAQ